MLNRGVKKTGRRVVQGSQRNLNILVIKLDHMGDFLLAIPALMRLRSKFKNAEIDIVVGEWNVALARKLNIFRQIFTYSCFQQESFKGPRQNLEQERKLLSGIGPYDIAIDLRRQPDTRYFLADVPAALKVGYKSFTGYDEGLDICLDIERDEPGRIVGPNKTNISYQMIRLVEAIPAETMILPPFTTAQPLANHIALFPGAGSPVKQWPIENYVSLIKKLMDLDYRFKLTVYLSRSEKYLTRFFSNLAGVEISVGLDVDKLIDSLATNVLAVANNSFGAHLSSYIGIPVVAIYGGHETVWEWQPPFGTSEVIYSDLDCSPCHIPSVAHCPYDLLCLRQITVETVIESILNLLKNNIYEIQKHSFYISGAN